MPVFVLVFVDLNFENCDSAHGLVGVRCLVSCYRLRNAKVIEMYRNYISPIIVLMTLAFLINFLFAAWVYHGEQVKKSQCDGRVYCQNAESFGDAIDRLSGEL